MSLPIFKHGEPLFTVIYRNTDARARLSKWITTSRSIQARVDDARMHIYDHNTLSLFVVTWTHTWDDIMIWDTYLKRHISV